MSEPSPTAPSPTADDASGRVPAARCHAAVLDAPLSLDAAFARVRSDEVGGVAMFVGVVRDIDDDRAVSGLDYQAHPSAEQRLAEVAAQVAARHAVLAVAVEHRTGSLRIGDLAVVVAVGARHRAAALRCCHELIDTLKTEVPIWKEQHYADGSVDWVGLP